MAKKLTYKFRNPNYNNILDNNLEFIPVWEFLNYTNNNNEINYEINLNEKVKIKTENLKNDIDLYNIVNNSSNQSSWWKQVSLDNKGYVPMGTKNTILSFNNDGQPVWINPTYSTHVHNDITITPKTPLTIKNKDNTENSNDFETILYKRGNESSTDYILNLDKFLCGITGSLNITPQTVSLITNTQ